jgi:HK97 family phage major capsid protein
MRIKLVQDYFNAKQGQVIEVKDADGLLLIKEGHVEYTAEMAKSDMAVVVEQFKKEIKMSDAVEVKKEVSAPNILIKTVKEKTFADGIKALVDGSVKEIVCKAPTGQAETTNGGADGGNLVYQGMDQLHGALTMESVLFPQCEKLPLGPNEWGRFIPIRDESTLTPTSAPRSYNPGEGVAGTPTVMKFNKIDLKLGKFMTICYLTDEVMADVNYLEQYVTSAMRGKLGFDMDNAILNGTYSANVQGMTGVFGATNFYTEPVAHASTYTPAIIAGIISGIDVRKRAGCSWYMSNSTHATLIGQLGMGATLSTQPLFSNNGMTLAGYPIVLMPQMAAFGSAGDVLFGNFREGYAVAERSGIVLSKSEDYAYLTDEVVLKATWKTLGSPTFRKYAPVDSRTVACFSSTSGT